jgi:anaerobic dimethyl sulfoxide reductase subunit C
MSEWPLILFTTAVQLSCGLALAATASDHAFGRSEGSSARALGISVFPLAATGVLASLFHLGRPLSAWRALSNLTSSPLSIEILISGLFFLAATGYGYLWWTRRNKGRPELGAVTSLMGLAAVASSAAVYLVPTEPAWNSPWVPLSFLGTAFLFGGLAPLAVADPSKEERPRGIFMAATAVGAAAVIVSAVWMVARLSAPPAGEFAAGRFREILRWLLSRGSVPLGASVALAGLLPMALVLKLWASGKPVVRMARLVLAGALAGAVIGRWLMYAVGTKFIPF